MDGAKLNVRDTPTGNLGAVNEAEAGANTNAEGCGGAADKEDSASGFMENVVGFISFKLRCDCTPKPPFIAGVLANSKFKSDRAECSPESTWWGTVRVAEFTLGLLLDDEVHCELRAKGDARDCWSSAADELDEDTDGAP